MRGATAFFLCALACGRSASDAARVRVQASRETAVALVANGARQVGDYGAFAVLDANEMQIGQADVERRPDDRAISLNAGRLDTSVAPRRFAISGLHLVQFDAPVRPEWLEALRSTGVRIVSYVPTNGYLVYGDAASTQQLAQHTNVSSEIAWASAFEPQHKTVPEAAAADRIVVQLVDGVAENEQTRALAQSLSTVTPHVSKAAGYINLLLQPTPGAVDLLAQRPDVVSILPYRLPKLLDERQDLVVAGDLSGNPASYLDWLTARGFNQGQFDASGFGIDLTDSGIDNGTQVPNHFGLYVGGNVSSRSRIVYNRLEGSPNESSSLAGCDGHGTINAHIIAGYDGFSASPFADAQGFRFGLGVAPFARLGSSVIFDAYAFTLPVYEDLQSRAYAAGMRISNNSWGGGEPHYDSDAQRYDALVRDAAPANSALPEVGNQEMTIVFASGNAATPSHLTEEIHSPANAKNVIVVGASEGTTQLGGADQCKVDDTAVASPTKLAFFSSRGPTLDNRIKPDLIAPGTHIVGGVAQSDAQRQSLPASPLGEAIACFTGNEICGGTDGLFWPSGQQWFTTSSGTSHSTPAVSGAVALLRQWFLNRGLPPPSPAMTKAYLMNSARYAEGVGDSLPSNSQGMGLLDLGAAFDDTPRLLRDELADDLLTATGQQKTFQVTPDPLKPVRVTLAWTDAPGATFASSALVNDLDLAAVAGGVIYLGNQFAGAFSQGGGAPDRSNNVESIYLPAGTSGLITVTVTAANIAGDGVPGNATLLDQDFALVVSNACSEVPPAVPQHLTATPGPNQVALVWNGVASSFVVERAPSSDGPFEKIASTASAAFLDGAVSAGVTYWYRVRAVSGCAQSATSSLVSAQPQGQCTKPPVFHGLDSADSAGTITCGATISWSPATPSCGGSISYNIYRGTDSSFVPSSENLVATTAETSFLDSGSLQPNASYWYVVRAVEGTNVDTNIIAAPVVPAYDETIFFDDFDTNRPPDPESHWIITTNQPDSQLSIVSGCHFQSGSAAYKFGTPDCGGYKSTNPYQGYSLLTMTAGGSDQTSAFYIPADAIHATLEFRKWHSFSFDSLDGYYFDGAAMLWGNTSATLFGREVVAHVFSTPEYTSFTGPTPWVPDNSYDAGIWDGYASWNFNDVEPNGALRKVVVNADQMAKSALWFAWLFQTQQDSPGGGFYLDDVRLHVQRPCSTQPVASDEPASFRVEGLPSESTPGVFDLFTVTALDANGNPLSTFNGTGKGRSSDDAAIVPTTLTFSGGVAHSSVMFASPGLQAIEALDDNGIARGAMTTHVGDASAASIEILESPHSGPVGQLGPMKINVLNAFGGPVQNTTVYATLGKDFVAVPGWSYTIQVTNGIGWLSVSAPSGKNYRVVLDSGSAATQTQPFDVFPGYAVKMQLYVDPTAKCGETTFANIVLADSSGSGASAIGYGPFDLALTDLEGRVTHLSSTAVTDLDVNSSFSVSEAGKGYQITATDLGGWLAPVSATFEAVAGDAKSMFLVASPSTIVASQSQQYVIGFRDAFGNATTSGMPWWVYVELTSDEQPPATLSGNNQIVPSNGQSVFDLAISSAGRRSLKFTAPQFSAPVTVGPFEVTAGSPAQYRLVGADSVVAGTAASLVAYVTDAGGDALGSYSGSVRVSISDAAGKAPTDPIAFDANGDARFEVTFATAGAQQLTLTDEAGVLHGVVAVQVTSPAPPAQKSGGGCSSTATPGFFALLLCVLLLRPRTPCNISQQTLQ